MRIWLRRFARCAALLIGAGTIALAGGVAPASADGYWRSCQAAWVIKNADTGGVIASRQFWGEGWDAMGPNHARRVARAYILGCAEGHWRQRDDDSGFLGCRANSGNHAIHAYPFHNLLSEITEIACDANPNEATLTLDLEIHLDGDTGCIPEPNRWATPIASGVRVTCPARIAPRPEIAPMGEAPRQIAPQPRLERSGSKFLPGVRLPGNDIRTDWIGDDTWQRCEEMCLETPGCNAWTWRRPGAGGPGSEAACLLKSRALVRVNDPCCHSGFVDR